jgi:hypothetical protein
MCRPCGKPHMSLRFGRVYRTPAMQAGCATKALTFRNILSWIRPPKRRRRDPVLDLTQPRRAGEGPDAPTVSATCTAQSFLLSWGNLLS